MGLAASQGRLLTITARLTSNEYESQQISNAKMRLATQTQEASQDYISALNNQQLSFVTFDNNGGSVQTALTPAVLYEYGDTKNQYLLTNAAGKALISYTDAQNYEKATDLQSFLELYGLKKTFKTNTLENAYNNLYAMQEYKDAYDKKANEYKAFKYAAIKNAEDEITGYQKAGKNDTETISSKDCWQILKNNFQVDYINALNEYNIAYDYSLDNDTTEAKTQLETAQTSMEAARANFEDNVTYESFIESQMRKSAEEEDQYIYNNFQQYKSAKQLYDEELSSEGLTPTTAFQWDDQTKAQWYTNLWYKLNGSSSAKRNDNNYAVLDNKTLTSKSWISDAIKKGNVNIENATYAGDEMTLLREDNVFLFNLNGIKWESKIYSSCSDIVASDNDKDIAQAEAEYQRRTAEINVKDEKYQRKLSLLDSEHHAMQVEYDSVKSAMDKNIGRSYKAFSG